MKGKIFHILLLLLIPAVLASGQKRGFLVSSRNAEPLATEEALRAQVEFLTDSLCSGRATGTPGSTWAQAGIARQFASAGLLPSGGSFFHGFQSDTGLPAHNIIGILPGIGSRYVVIAAHYDHIGTLGGKMYPGADSNASGVAALLTIAKMFKHLQELGRTFSHSIIFVALDAKEQSLGGSRHLWREIENDLLKDPRTGIPISEMQIDRMVNIDQVGGTDAPLHKGRPDFLIMLSDERDGRREALYMANTEPGLNLDLGFTYYGSKDFTRVFYRNISDQKFFLDNRIPSVMFTSGITLLNNKPEDTAATLNYPIFRRRVLLMFYYLARII